MICKKPSPPGGTWLTNSHFFFQLGKYSSSVLSDDLRSKSGLPFFFLGFRRERQTKFENLKQTRPVIYGSCGELTTAAAAVFCVFRSVERNNTSDNVRSFSCSSTQFFFFSSNNTALGANLLGRPWVTQCALFEWSCPLGCCFNPLLIYLVR